MNCVCKDKNSDIGIFILDTFQKRTFQLFNIQEDSHWTVWNWRTDTFLFHDARFLCTYQNIWLGVASLCKNTNTGKEKKKHIKAVRTVKVMLLIDSQTQASAGGTAALRANNSRWHQGWAQTAEECWDAMNNSSMALGSPGVGTDSSSGFTARTVYCLLKMLIIPFSCSLTEHFSSSSRVCHFKVSVFGVWSFMHLHYYGDMILYFIFFPLFSLFFFNGLCVFLEHACPVPSATAGYKHAHPISCGETYLDQGPPFYQQITVMTCERDAGRHMHRRRSATEDCFHD